MMQIIALHRMRVCLKIIINHDLMGMGADLCPFLCRKESHFSQLKCNLNRPYVRHNPTNQSIIVLITVDIYLHRSKTVLSNTSQNPMILGSSKESFPFNTVKLLDFMYSAGG